MVLPKVSAPSNEEGDVGTVGVKKISGKLLIESPGAAPASAALRSCGIGDSDLKRYVLN